jgi:ATP-binding cassette subfamily B protein RaxB
MDEASSNLDVKTEYAINTAIAELNITRIIIAHRPQTIRNADKVYRLTPKGLISIDEKTMDSRTVKHLEKQTHSSDRNTLNLAEI